MDRSKAQAMLDDARAELVTAESTVAYLRQVVHGLEGLLKMVPPAPVPAVAPSAPVAAANGHSVKADQPTPYLRPSAAVLDVLRSRPNYPMEFGQLWAEMSDRGLIDPKVKSGRNAYSNAATRLAERPETNVHRLEDGKYVFRTQGGDSSMTSHQQGETEEDPQPELEVSTS